MELEGLTTWLDDAWHGLEAHGWMKTDSFCMSPEGADEGVIIPNTTIFNTTDDCVKHALLNLPYSEGLAAMEDPIWDHMQYRLKWQVLQLQSGVRWFAQPGLKLGGLQPGVNLYEKRIQAIMAFLQVVLGLKRKRVEVLETEMTKRVKSATPPVVEPIALPEGPNPFVMATPTKTAKKRETSPNTAPKRRSPKKATVADGAQTPPRRSPRSLEAEVKTEEVMDVASHTPMKATYVKKAPSPISIAAVAPTSVAMTPKKRSPTKSTAVTMGAVADETCDILLTPKRRGQPSKAAQSPAVAVVSVPPPAPATPSKMGLPPRATSPMPVGASTPTKRARASKALSPAASMTSPAKKQKMPDAGDVPMTPPRTSPTKHALPNSPMRSFSTPKKQTTPPSVSIFGSPAETKHSDSEWQPIFDKKPRSVSSPYTTSFASSRNSSIKTSTPSRRPPLPPTTTTSVDEESQSPMSISHILSSETAPSTSHLVARNLNLASFQHEKVVKREADFESVSNAMNDLLDGAYSHLTHESPTVGRRNELDTKFAATPDVEAHKAVPLCTPPSKAVNLVFRRRVLTTFLSSGWQSVAPPINGKGNYFYMHKAFHGKSIAREDLEQYAIEHDVFAPRALSNPSAVFNWVMIHGKVHDSNASPAKTPTVSRKLLSPSPTRRISFNSQ
ncbi:hypothetical protein SDRG_05534 [Saprolegnia diclina VS20]|uniref:Uncharacterized protein n=1 Tax=Saprolegnia diclina (strain VS20) TaxID=1156394 RepID=T0RXE3_SAPDV|nr:hypothetical protein SDRG_05534 [Saprolegnia diclina VS20]EQC37313.1 hypothetical protein SDRG_05534 [Saprolegnia diclina VS20]|eukprot:XP_008609475.1 hypothetical protein SDRG_05534 [Saprolegnia diclina VS20]